MEKLIALFCAIADEQARRGNEAACLKAIEAIYDAWDLGVQISLDEALLSDLPNIT
ncbi:MAG: hypothetical protein ABF727_15615 [Gluconobacter oxydans]